MALGTRCHNKWRVYAMPVSWLFEPSKCYLVDLNCDPDAAIRKLAEYVEPPGIHFLWTNRNRKPFKGEIGVGHFRITRIIHYRNSVRPVIRGSTVATDNGPSLLLSMRMSRAVSIGYKVMLCGAVLYAFAYFAIAFIHGTVSLPRATIAIAIPVAMVGLGRIFFLIEANVGL